MQDGEREGLRKNGNVEGAVRDAGNEEKQSDIIFSFMFTSCFTYIFNLLFYELL